MYKRVCLVVGTDKKLGYGIREGGGTYYISERIKSVAGGKLKPNSTSTSLSLLARTCYIITFLRRIVHRN